MYAICLMKWLSQVDRFASQTKTLVGHNLEPTPWHIFPPKSFDEASRYSRASKIIQCSYLSCGRATAAAAIPKNIQPQLSNNCPEFFSHIHQDLEPWMKSKISIAHINEAQKFSSFRIVIVGGKLYADFYYDCVQSRAMFTVWGLLQLLRRYPGRIPDVDLMFDCMDKPTINRTEHSSQPLPLFRYCTTRDHFDIPFPDWSFWSWYTYELLTALCYILPVCYKSNWKLDAICATLFLWWGHRHQVWRFHV